MHMKDNTEQNRRAVQAKLRILAIKLVPKTLHVNNHEEFPNKCREKLFRLCGFDPRFFFSLSLHKHYNCQIFCYSESIYLLE